MRAMRKRMAMTTAMTVPKAVQLFGQRFVVGVVQLQGDGYVRVRPRDADAPARGVVERQLGLVGEVVVLETVNEEQRGYSE
jgi:hypothetical protein